MHENTRILIQSLLERAQIEVAYEPYDRAYNWDLGEYPYAVRLRRKEGDMALFIIYIDAEKRKFITKESIVLWLSTRILCMDQYRDIGAWMDSFEEGSSERYLYDIVNTTEITQAERRAAYNKLASKYWYVRALEVDLRTVFAEHYKDFIRLLVDASIQIGSIA